ncbi:MAG TPA: prepilin-type N-terminal cleavage/methylation domain-containing protein [Acidobacteriota bacterium]|nr:prepilin-type N-terminal cleavage/methylation domain-containing protein [Acidobacteriota bacterium]
MHPVRMHQAKSGYTLIELLVVVIIIGIIAALAIPRFMGSTSKPKTAEARTILKQVFVMQRAYRQEYDTYWGNGLSADKANPDSFLRISVQVMPSARYTYTIAADKMTFQCTATANIDDDPTIDTWTIDDQGNLVNTVDDCAN